MKVYLVWSLVQVVLALLLGVLVFCSTLEAVWRPGELWASEYTLKSLTRERDVVPSCKVGAARVVLPVFYESFMSHCKVRIDVCCLGTI